VVGFDGIFPKKVVWGSIIRNCYNLQSHYLPKIAAVFSILIVVICALLFAQSFFNGRDFYSMLTRISSRGGFLILASVAVGTLYEQKEQRLQELRNAYVGVLEILAKYLESTDRYTRVHSVRVSALVAETAIAIELPRTEVETILFQSRGLFFNF
jgi:hypothetical protein